MKKQWSIVRHCAGYLGRRVDDLSKAVTDMLVRQKQVGYNFPRSYTDLYLLNVNIGSKYQCTIDLELIDEP